MTAGKKSTDKSPTKKVGKRAIAKSKGSSASPPVAKIERWPLSRLIPYASNPRLHSTEQVAQIAALMKEFGQTQLVVVDERGEIIVGHGRVLAAQSIGWTSIVVGVATDWTTTQKRAYRIADNRVAEEARWDRTALISEIADLKLENFDIELLAFSNDQLRVFLTDGSDGGDNGPQLEGMSYSVIVRCKDEGEQRRMLSRFQKQGLECSALIS